MHTSTLYRGEGGTFGKLLHSLRINFHDCSKMAAVKKVGQKNGEVGLLVEYLFCALGTSLEIVCHINNKY